MTTWNKLFSEHAGAAFARQLAFADFLGPRNWSVDIAEGECRFGSDLRYPIQLLGTESDGDGTWLWAWANEASNLPESLLRSSNSLKALGQKMGIEELFERSFSLDVASGHAIAMVASGIEKRCCYYRGPYGGGALFFLVNDVPISLLQPVEAARAITVISQVISQFDVDHRFMAESFLKSQQFQLERNDAKLIATRENDSLTLTFDNQERIAEIGGTLNAAARNKPWWKFWI